MKLNSLAFRLFATAAAWTLLVLPLVGVIIDSLHTKEAYGSHERRIGLLLELIRRDSIDHGGTEPGSPKDTGELLFEITHSGWYWQIKPLEGQAGRKLISVSLDNMTFALPSDRNVPPDDREVRWADLEGPVGGGQHQTSVDHVEAGGHRSIVGDGAPDLEDLAIDLQLGADVRR